MLIGGSWHPNDSGLSPARRPRHLFPSRAFPYKVSLLAAMQLEIHFFLTQIFLSKKIFTLTAPSESRQRVPAQPMVLTGAVFYSTVAGPVTAGKNATNPLAKTDDLSSHNPLVASVVG